MFDKENETSASAASPPKDLGLEEFPVWQQDTTDVNDTIDIITREWTRWLVRWKRVWSTDQMNKSDRIKMVETARKGLDQFRVSLRRGTIHLWKEEQDSIIAVVAKKVTKFERIAGEVESEEKIGAAIMDIAKLARNE